jgi:putative ATPase
VSQEYFPPRLSGRKYYVPSDFGFEKTVEKRIRWWEQKRKKDRGNAPGSTGGSGPVNP